MKKIRKRILIGLLACCLTVSLMACSAGNGEAPAPESGVVSGGNVQETVSPGNSVEEDSSSETFLLEAFLFDNGAAPVGNMQKNVPSGNFVSAGGKTLFTATDRDTEEIQVFCYDPAEKSVTTFCKDATCRHLSLPCAAGGVNCNLESCSGEIYGGQFGGSVMQLKNDAFEPVLKSGASHFFHYGDNLFVASMDSSLIVFEGSSGKPRTLIENYTGYWEVISGGYLYYQSGDICRIKLSEAGARPEVLVENASYITDGSHLYYAKTDDGRLYRCEMDGSNPEQLTDREVLVASWNFDDEYFYFRCLEAGDMAGDSFDAIAAEGSRDIYRFPKEDPSQVEKIAELPVPAFQIYTDAGSDTLFITPWQRRGELYVVNKRDLTVEQVTY